MNVELIETGFRLLSPVVILIMMGAYANLLYKPKVVMKIPIEFHESIICILLSTVTVLSGWGMYYIIRGMIVGG